MPSDPFENEPTQVENAQLMSAQFHECSQGGDTPELSTQTKNEKGCCVPEGDEWGPGSRARPGLSERRCQGAAVTGVVRPGLFKEKVNQGRPNGGRDGMPICHQREELQAEGTASAKPRVWSKLGELRMLPL